ncbi:MAG: hypothetical protein HUU35_18285, partial [Armatimonadetes bacterium]|nr:hypothetical protein [Armatimonadota bacterium]
LALLALPGALATWRAGWARRLLAVIGLHLLLIATYELWRSGFAPAGRQLLPVVPLLGPFVAAGAAAMPPRGRWLVPALVAVNSGQVLLGAWLPRLRYPVYEEGLVRQPLLARLGPLGEVWPAVGASDLATAAAWVYLGAWVALSVAAVRGKGSQA